MRTLKLIICMLFAFSASVFATDLTPAQQKAQRHVYDYLKQNNYKPVIDASDNSVCFHDKEVLYWVSFESESPVLYSFHRKGFKVAGEKAYKRCTAIVAANEVNSKHQVVKLSVGEKKVDIAIQVYAKSPEDFTAVFKQYFKLFEKIDSDFIAAYNKAEKAKTECVKKEEVVQETVTPVKPSVLRDQVNGVSFRLTDANGKAVSEYDQPIRSYGAQYVQTRVTFKANKKEAKYNLQMRIYRPDGRSICLKGKNISSEKEVTLKKSKKEQNMEFDIFGSAQEGFWNAGEYKVEVIESGNVIYTTTFNML